MEKSLLRLIHFIYSLRLECPSSISSLDDLKQPLKCQTPLCSLSWLSFPPHLDQVPYL